MSNVTNHQLSVVTVFVQDCQFSTFWSTLSSPLDFSFGSRQLFCRARQNRYEEATKCSPVEVNGVPVEVRTTKQ